MKNSKMIFILLLCFSSPLLGMWREPIVSLVSKHKGKAAAGGYLLYSGLWYFGVAGLTYHTKKTNDHNQELIAFNQSLLAEAAERLKREQAMQAQIDASLKRIDKLELALGLSSKE